MTRALGRGVYAVLATTFDGDDRVVAADLTAQADFVATNAQGVVWPAIASRFYLLGRDEIAAGFTAVAGGVRERVPFVAGVTQLTTADAVALAEAAREAGADAVVAMPPWMSRVTGKGLVRHFRALAGVGLPIMLQNASDFSDFSALAPTDLRRLIDEVPEIVALKDEAPVLPQTITRGLGLMPPERGLVFGGGDARYLIDELERGGAGNLAGVAWVDVAGAAFGKWTLGDKDGARWLHAAAQVGGSAIAAYGDAGTRWVLRRRGVTSSTRGRLDDAAELDEHATAELDAVIKQLWPALPWHAPRPD
jgi:dihydrodipicolinate synthase/N-acetylneuraminate lyase